MPIPASPTRSFLVEAPKPAKIRVHVAGEPPRELVPRPGLSWIKLANSVDAFSPTLIECLDAEGKTLRARNPNELPASEVADDEPSELAEGDTTIELFARLLSDAHKASGERAFTFVETAFARMVDIVNAQTKRLDSMQAVVEGVHKSWRRAYEQQIAEGPSDEEAPAGGAMRGQDLLIQMLANFAQGMHMQNGAAANGAAKANGHATPKGEQ